MTSIWGPSVDLAVTYLALWHVCNNSMQFINAVQGFSSTVCNRSTKGLSVLFLHRRDRYAVPAHGPIARVRWVFPESTSVATAERPTLLWPGSKVLPCRLQYLFIPQGPGGQSGWQVGGHALLERLMHIYVYVTSNCLDNTLLVCFSLL